MWKYLVPVLMTGLLSPSEGCLSLLPPMQGFARRLGKAATDMIVEVPMINVPGQRFTATHGIQAKKGEHKLFLFTVEDSNANYAALSGNVAVAGVLQGAPQKYEMYLKYGSPPTVAKYDYRAQVTAADSYNGEKLYSRDIRIERPIPGQYYLLIRALEDFQELLVTAIVDTPPDIEEERAAKPGFTIQRMGKYQ
ncbi:uncharacterized protein LOC111711058 [Eurytemora carolleeae]|uniref:uncharacterized protein LOC111711058 n=1 Tax=Eurytemora carolleeae TaxID=1294199 RepID=UPI000C75F379|nr:uncharacterized protein LOC111711058 [Eurytemora carolleeae]|eukprot:XP_023341065.1 uncharacterized protein LOC111711058 [Eurytemora affinis]